MTPAQCRAARALLAITQQRLADMADVSLHTITDFEMEQRQISQGLVHTIEVTLEAAGIHFIPEHGFSTHGGFGVRIRHLGEKG